MAPNSLSYVNWYPDQSILNFLGGAPPSGGSPLCFNGTQAMRAQESYKLVLHFLSYVHWFPR